MAREGIGWHMVPKMGREKGRKGPERERDPSQSRMPLPPPEGPHIRYRRRRRDENDWYWEAIGENGATLGTISYEVAGMKVRILGFHVLEPFQHHGIGTTLIDRLAEDHGYENIDWKLVTEGDALIRQAMDRRYLKNKETAATI